MEETPNRLGIRLTWQETLGKPGANNLHCPRQQTNGRGKPSLPGQALQATRGVHHENLHVKELLVADFVIQ